LKYEIQTPHFFRNTKYREIDIFVATLKQGNWRLMCRVNKWTRVHMDEVVRVRPKFQYGRIVTKCEGRKGEGTRGEREEGQRKKEKKKAT